MSRITDYAELTSPAGGDVLPVVDVSDPTMSPDGTTKKITVSTLLSVSLSTSFSVLNPSFNGGADPTGATDSTTAINDCVAAASAAGMPVIIPAGTYKISAALDWRIAGLQVVGDGKQNTIIRQTASNVQIVRVAGAHQRISGLQFQYSTQQPAGDTSAVGLSLGDDTVGSCFESIFEDLYIVQAQTGIAVDPSVATVGGAFSCVFRSIRISQNGGQSGISVVASNGTGANITGNKWEAIYVSNNWNGTTSTWGGHPVAFQGCDNDHISVFNIEHGNAFNGDILSFTNCLTTVVDDLHIESVPVSGTPGFGFILANGATVNIRGMQVRNQTLTGTSQNPVVRYGSSSTGNLIQIDGYSQPSSTGISTVHPWADFNSSTDSSLILRNITSTRVTTGQVNAGAGCHVGTSGAEDWINIATLGADPSGTNDCSAILQLAVGMLPASGGTVYFPAGLFKINSTVTVVNKQVYFRGAGRWATTLKFTGTGDCLRVYSTTTLSAPVSGAVVDLTIDGTGAGAGSAGLHMGDMRAYELGCAVQNFTGTGSMLVHLDNQYAWTEETHGYLWLSNGTQMLVFDVSAPAPTTVAAGSNGGTIANIATWGAGFGGNGVLSVAATTPALTSLYPTSGTLAVAASGSTTAVITYTGLTNTSFTGCAYVSGSPSGTVATGGAVGLVTSDNSFGYSDLTVEILAKVGQDGLVCQGGAVLYNSRVNVKANFQGSTTTNTSAAIRLTGAMPANHPHSNGSSIQNSDFSFMAECGSSPGSNAPQTIAFGTLTGSQLNFMSGCVGVLDFTFGALAFAQTNYTSGGAAGAFSFMGLVLGDFNLNPATTGLGQGVSYYIGAPVSYSRSLLNVINGNVLIDKGDYFQGTLGANLAINLVGGGSAFGCAQRKTIVLQQAASGGPYTVTWPYSASPTTASPTIVWENGVPPVMTQVAGAKDAVFLETYDGATWFGRYLQAGLGGADPTGTADSTAVIQAAITANAGGQVVLPAGTYLLNTAAVLALSAAGTKLRGEGSDSTIIKIGASFTGAEAISITADGCEVSDLSIIGPTSTTASNPVADAISFAGQQRVKIRDVFFQYINGRMVNAQGGASRASVDLMLARLTGRNCAAGIHCLGVTGSNFLGEYFITDLQMQQMGVTSGASANMDALLIEDITDVLVQGVNIGTATGTIGGAIHIKGACATVEITNPDVGANATVSAAPSVLIESGTNGSVSGMTIGNGRVGGGSTGILVSAGNGILVQGIRAHVSYGTGMTVTGGEVLAVGCSFASNNQNGGTAYDVDTSGMSSGNARFSACRFETPIGTGVGLVPQSVNTSTHAYYKGCYFQATGTAPSNVFTGTPQQVTECVGYNPRGSVTPPGFGTSPWTPGGYQAPLMVIFTAINSLTAFAIGGVAVPLPVAGVPYFIGVRQSMTLTWSGTTPAWQWFSL